MAEAVLENNEIKQRAVRRLVVAVALVLLAVGILTYLSYSKPAKVITKPVPDTLAPPPPPIVTGPEPVPVDAAQALPEPAPIASPPLTSTPVVQPPPPPPIVRAKPLAQASPEPKKILPAQPQKPIVKTDAEPPKPSTAVTPSPAAAGPPKSAPSSYVIQFGVFSNPQNATQLVEKLKQAGIGARTETRVQLPAFTSKAEAEAALAKMKQKGISATIVAR